MLRSLVRHAACVVVSNPALAAADYLRVAKRVEVIPFGIPVEDFVAAEVGARARASAIRERHGTPVVLFVGRLVYYKGVDVLLRAMASCPGTLLLVGEGPEESALRALSRRLGIEDRVKFLGHVSAEALTHHLYAADVFVLPSTHRTEAFGVVQLEAMACGVPVVSTDLPTGVPWVNQHGITGLVVPPNDEKALAEALRALLGDPALRHSLGQAGRRRATADFTQERMVAAFVRLIEDICEPV
jgi:rhamnosyl/mannosyltransferase